MNRFPTTKQTRNEFLPTDKGAYLLSFRLTQTELVGYQVGIEELVEFTEEVKWILKEHDIPIRIHKVDAHDITLSINESSRSDIDGEEVEHRVEKLAKKFDIALEKSISLNRGDDQKVSVSYSYGWDYNQEDLVNNPNSSHARSVWVGGYRGRPETMGESTIKIKSFTSPEPSFFDTTKNLLKQKLRLD